MISISIIDNDMQFLNSSMEYLQRFSNLDFKVVYTSRDYRNNTAGLGEIDVLLIDQNALELKEIEYLKNTQPNCRLIILSNTLNSIQIIPALKLGVSGYILKTSKYHELYEAAMIAYSGGSILGPHVAKIVIDSIKNRTSNPDWKILSKREQEFAIELLKGATYNQISNKLFVSLSTVSFHLQNIYLKLNIKSKAEFISKYHSSIAQIN